MGTGSEADVDLLFATGNAAVQTGDFATAIAVFRKCTYLQPDDVAAHLHLGLALERSGDVRAAPRAFAAARSALDRSEASLIEATLEGFHVDELARFLEAKAAGAR